MEQTFLVVHCAGSVQGNHYAWAQEKSFASEEEANNYVNELYDAGENILYYGLECDFVDYTY